MRRQVAVIGRGIVGLSIAFALAEDGWQVTVIGPKAALGSATRAAVGTSTLKGNIAAFQPLFALKIAAHKRLQAWLTRIEQASDRHIPCNFTGAFEPFRDVCGYRYVRERVFHRQFTGCLDVAIWPQQRLQRFFQSTGQFPQAALGAYHYYRDGWFDPTACLDALEEALIRLGARFIDTSVRAIWPHPDEGVSLDLGDAHFRTPECVVAAGVFSDAILGASGLSDLKQDLVEGETVIGAASNASSVILKAGTMNFVVDGGQIRVGSTSRRQDVLAACAPSHESARELSRLAVEQFNATEFSTLWGIRGRYKNKQPALGSLILPSSQRTIWAALGFYKNGLQLGHLFAQNLARLIATEATPSTAFPLPLETIKTQ